MTAWEPPRDGRESAARGASGPRFAFVPAGRCGQAAGPVPRPPPSPAPRPGRPARPHRGAEPPPRLQPARADTKARRPAEEERPHPPRVRPYPAAPPPAAPAAVPDRRAPPRGRHGCYCSTGRGRCRRSGEPAALTAFTPPSAAVNPTCGRQAIPTLCDWVCARTRPSPDSLYGSSLSA